MREKLISQMDDSRLLSFISQSAEKDNYRTPCYILLFAWVLSAPVAVFTGNIRLSYTLCFMGAVVMFLYYLVSKALLLIKYNRKPHIRIKVNYTFWFSMVLLLTLIASIFAEESVETAFLGTTYRNDGFIGYCFYAVIFISAIHIRRDRERILLLVKLAVITSLTMSLIAILQYVGVMDGILEAFPFITYGRMRIYTGSFYNENHYAYYLGMIIAASSYLYFICDRKKERILYLVCTAINIWVLIQNNTLGTYLALLITFVVMLPLLSVYRGGFSIKYLIPLAIFGIITVLTPLLNNLMSTVFGITPVIISDTFTELDMMGNDVSNILENNEYAGEAGTLRWQLWIETIESIKEHPLLGVGPENMVHYFVDRGLDRDRPHNEYLQYAAFMGIPAGLCYIAGLFSILAGCLKKLRKLPGLTLVTGAAVITYGISAFFGNTMYYTSPYFFMILGFTIPVGEQD